ncbi:MAG: DUF4236 domain-containing protein [Candidatus Dormibacteria bacterium]
MGYLRFRRSKSLIPGVRMNLTKSGVSWTFGPRGLHYTVGARGSRATVGVPGTGLSYTSYSHAHARRASQQRASGRPAPVAAGSQAPSTPREPMLPMSKIALGVVLAILGLALALPGPVIGVPLACVGIGYLVVGMRQRKEPLWQVRTFLRKVTANPSTADELISAALAIDGDNPEALAAMANLRFHQQRWAEAGELYERYLKHSPDDILAVGHAGNAWANADQPDRAIPFLVRARDDDRFVDDTRASVSAVLAMAYIKKKNAEQALAVVGSQPLSRHNLEEGLQQCLYVRAIASYMVGRKSKGIADLDRLARINPNFDELETTRQEMLQGNFNSPEPAPGT